MTKITFANEAGFMRQSGVAFIRELLIDGERTDAPISVRQDRKTIADWIGYGSGDLTPDQARRLAQGWSAYLAIGLAPSAKLQDAFSHFAQQLHDFDKAERPPTAVMSVFDRLLATDEEIALKRAADIEAERERFRPIFEQAHIRKRPKAASGWWREQTPLVRSWLFFAAVWAGLMLLYAFFFDPFDTGGWRYMDDDETARLVLIMFAPIPAGALFYIYRKWIR